VAALPAALLAALLADFAAFVAIEAIMRTQLISQFAQRMERECKDQVVWSSIRREVEVTVE
jgi:hypothetical protein